MLMHPFQRLALHNRLGQPIHLDVCHLQHQGRDLVFARAPDNNPHFFGKNAETLAFQLREYFSLDGRRLDLIEMRTVDEADALYRWRFEWVGHSPLSGRVEALVEGQVKFMLGLLNSTQVAATA